jgi:hypothetical protein
MVYTWELAHEASRPLSRFVDFGEVSETCTPVSAGEAAQSFRPTIDLCYMGVKRTHVNLYPPGAPGTLIARPELEPTGQAHLTLTRRSCFCYFFFASAASRAFS